MPRHNRILTVGPDIKGSGGISTVLQSYSRSFDDFTYLPSNSRRGSVAGALVLAGTMLRLPLMRLRGYNVLHAHGASAKSFRRKNIIRRWAALLGFRTIFHCHGGGFRHYAETAGMQATQRRLARWDALAVLTEGWQDWFRESMHHPSVHVVHNIVEENPAAAPRKPRRDQEPLRLLFLGKVCRDKGVFDLVDAIASLEPSIRRHVHLTVAGTGETDAMAELAAAKGVSVNISFVGWVRGAAKDALMNSHDAVVLPSYIEGLPIVLLEAGVFGMPSVATTVGGIPELIADGRNGFLIEPGNVSQLAEAIRKLAENPDNSTAMGSEARSRIEPYLPQNIRKELSNLYNSI